MAEQERKSTEIRGKRKICEYMNRAWRTLLALREKNGFPMEIIGNTWVIDTDLVKQWRTRQLQRR